MAGEQAPSDTSGDHLQEAVEHVHVEVGTEVHGKPIENFICREMPLAKMELFDIHIDPIAIHRRSEDIARDANVDYLLATQLEGTVLVSQGESEFTQHPGDLSIMYAGQPYSIVHTQKSRRLILHIPQDIYRERILAHLQDRSFAPGCCPAVGW